VTGGARVLTLTLIRLVWVCAWQVVPAYGGGMSSAKAQLESDTKVLALKATGDPLALPSSPPRAASEAGRIYLPTHSLPDSPTHLLTHYLLTHLRGRCWRGRWAARMGCASTASRLGRSSRAPRPPSRRATSAPSLRYAQAHPHPNHHHHTFACHCLLSRALSLSLSLARSLSPTYFLTYLPTLLTSLFTQVGIDYYLANAPLQKNLYSDDIGAVAAALCSPAFGAMTGETIYVDNGDLT
jgi:hypothetical protein